jgi:hypothetical protein
VIHVAGTLGVAANGWLVSDFLVSPLINVKTHLLMLNLAIACLGRGMLAGFPFIAASTLAGRFVNKTFGTQSTAVRYVPPALTQPPPHTFYPQFVCVFPLWMSE